MKYLEPYFEQTFGDREEWTDEMRKERCIKQAKDEISLITIGSIGEHCDTNYKKLAARGGHKYRYSEADRRSLRSAYGDFNREAWDRYNERPIPTPEETWDIAERLLNMERSLLLHQ